MIFWLLALVLLASLAGFGYQQGAIRMAFSSVGILLARTLETGDKAGAKVYQLAGDAALHERANPLQSRQGAHGDSPA